MKRSIFSRSKAARKRATRTNLVLGITSIAFAGLIASSVVAQQYYSQPVYSSSQVQGQVVYSQNSAPVYESVPTPYPVFQNEVTSTYPQNVSYSSPPVSSQVVYPSTTVYPSTVSQPVVSSQPVIQSYPVSYPSPQPVTYSSSPVVNHSTQTYPTQTYSAQTYPTGTYVDGTYATNGTYASNTYPVTNYSQPVTYTSASVAPAVAQPIVSQPVYSQPSYSQPVTYSQPATSYSTSTGNSYASTGSVVPGLAQQKAVQAAQMRMQGHLNNNLGGAKYEGVGWSNQSAQQAIQNCCYWGTRPTAQIGVSQSSDGTWYACVLYH